MHLLSVRVTKERYCLKKGLKIDLKTVNLLVGDQGCGKSTLLKLLRDYGKEGSEHIELELSEEVITKGVSSFYFDSESMNPRVRDINEYSTPSGHSKGIGIGGAIACKFMSHGETLKKFTVDIISESKNSVLLLDEPEAALSLRNQFELAKKINELSSNNVQVIIATHCLPIIESVEEVYSLEHLRWMPSEEFIKLNKQ